ncbi:1-hydroxycarotenoid 3,4-desaturase CrtD [Flagellimonas sp. DF-77]|uniref:1-hydroxycarotenoid 3,4-desaturase CrtD n=1 Tax=Flagellimonas algarum TaxID=3230298 RepID=UPI00339688A0
MPKAVIIGSGIAGIATSIRLRQAGYEVSVFESNDSPGGKLRSKQVNGFRFDLGPSLFTLPHLVDELFERSDKDPRDYFNYDKLDASCTYYWEDGTAFKAPSAKDAFVKAASETFGEATKNIDRYLDSSALKLRLTSPLFLERSLHRAKTYLGFDTFKALMRMGRMDIFKTLHRLNEKHFSNPKLVQLFDRYATYNGSSPFKTPGIMSMIPQLELGQGTYFPKGGMVEITNSLVRLAKELGVEFQFEQPVTRIHTSRKEVRGIKTATEKVQADIVVSNMDVYPTFRRLLPGLKAPEFRLKQQRSSAAIIFYWGVAKSFELLDHHNILFSEDYDGEFESIFNKAEVPVDPTIYVNVTCKTAPDDAPSQKENWFVMVNTPANEGQDWETLIPKVKRRILEKMERLLGEPIAPLIEYESVLDPIGIEKQTGSYQGALYGAASNSKFAAFLRQPNFSRHIRGLYFCGGSVHPGGGIPLCLYSAKITSDLIQADHG